MKPSSSATAQPGPQSPAASLCSGPGRQLALGSSEDLPLSESPVAPGLCCHLPTLSNPRQLGWARRLGSLPYTADTHSLQTPHTPFTYLLKLISNPPNQYLQDWHGRRRHAENSEISAFPDVHSPRWNVVTPCLVSALTLQISALSTVCTVPCLPHF